MTDEQKLEQLRRMRLLWDCVSTTMYYGPRMRVLMLDNPKLAEAMETLASELIKHPELFRGGEIEEKAHKEYCLMFGKVEENDLICPPLVDTAWEG